jgi:glyoxylase-like metal-dependent hydrolase (beta-lactamase superfamily II)
MGFRISRYVVGPFATNCYFVWDEGERKVAIVDPGGDADLLLAELDAMKLEPAAILLTHGHIDHLMAVPELKGRFGVQVFAHAEERPILESAPMQAEMFQLPYREVPQVDEWLQDGSEVRLNSLTFRVIHTPGHSPGGCCFQLDRVIFVGDTLFEASIGRTDLPGGDHEQLLRSIRERLFVLDDDVEVYPGHGEKTTIGKEKRFNPFL